MKKIIFKSIQVLSVVSLLLSCGGASVEVSTEMNDFNSMINGSHEDVSKAVEKYAASETLNDNDIVYFGLSNPVVTEATQDCYLVDYEAGITIRSYEICWDEGKIVSIVEKGMK